MGELYAYEWGTRHNYREAPTMSCTKQKPEGVFPAVMARWRQMHGAGPLDAGICVDAVEHT